MQLLTKSIEGMRETYAGLRWVWREIVSAESRRYQLIALGFLIVTNLCQMSVPYAFKVVIDAHSSGRVTERDWWIIVAVAVSAIAVGFNIVYDYFREHAWNNNFLTSNLTIVQKLLARTIDELISESSDIGIEQAESIKDRVQTILYLLMFDLSVVLVSIISATVLVFTVSFVAGLMVLGLTVFNLLWFLIFNARLEDAMTLVDKDFRRATRRMVEKLTFVQSIKAGGVERKIASQVKGELEVPLAADLKIWAGWFLRVELIRRLINAVTPIVIIWLGIIAFEWSAGTIAAMFFWIFFISREYGFVGHLMRHLSSQVARLQAARKALSLPPAFRFDAGVSYTPTYEGDKHAH